MQSPFFAPPLLLRSPRPKMASRPHSFRRLSTAQQIQPPPTTGKGSLSETGQVRVRQHVNPLARRWSRPLELPPDWYSIAFKDPTLPLVIDLGVAKGRFLTRMATRDKDTNFLGLEIREPLVHQANRIATEMGLGNLFYLACNANVSFRGVVRDVPKGVLSAVYVQFCDPWFKKRHAKRRMVNEGLVGGIYEGLMEGISRGRSGSGGMVFLQSDVLEVACEMRDLFEAHGEFCKVGEEGGAKVGDGGWLTENPIGEKTEREIAVLNKGGEVYRVLFQVKNTAEQR